MALAAMSWAVRKVPNGADPEVTETGRVEGFLMVEPSSASAKQRPGSAKGSLVGTLSQGEPDVLVTAEGAFASRIAAPDGQTYTRLTVPGCGADAQGIGYPEMPFKGFFLEVPYGVDVSVELVDVSPVSLGTGFLVYPKQPPLPDIAHALDPDFEIDSEAYGTDAFFPAEPVVLDHPGFIRGRRVVFVQVFPLQYNPITTELRAFLSLRFNLVYEGTRDRTGQARKMRLATRESEHLARDLIINFEPLPQPDALQSSGERALSTSDAADYLIIVADDLYDDILPLAEWKHKKGFITRVADMNEVGSTSSDVNDYIFTAYHTWDPAPSYVLLVGDHNDVPSNIITGHPYHNGCDPNSPHEWVSDQLYAYVDGDDYYPDLTIARLSVHTATECNDVVTKILKYDRDPNTGDWYDDFLVAAYFQDTWDDCVADRWFMETAMTTYDFVVNDLNDYTGHTALCTTHWALTCDTNSYHFRNSNYPHRSDLNQIRWGQSPYPDPVPTWIVDLWTSAADATTDITTAVNGGVGIVQHRDHGDKYEWSDPPYDTNKVNSDLANGEETPVIFSICCLTGAFDDYRWENANTCHSTGDANDCFAEAWLKHDSGGAVGIVASTRVSYSGYNDLLTHGIYTCFWSSYDPNYTDANYPRSWRPAEALNYGKYYMKVFEGLGNTTELTFNLFHWFGDPEMMLHTKTPQALSVSYDPQAEPGVSTDYTVTVTKDGNSLEGALVAITHVSRDDHWTGYTDANGSVTFSSITFTKDDSNDPNHYDIVVSARNCIPYEGLIFLYESGLTIKDSSGDPVAWFDSYGNLVLKGMFDESSSHAATANDEFRFQDPNASDVMIIDTTNGNMYIDGSLQASWQAPSGANDELIVENSSAAVSYVNSSGNLYLKGLLYEESIP
jgi:hypothetical protein